MVAADRSSLHTFNRFAAALCFRHEGNDEQEVGGRSSSHEQKRGGAAYTVADVSGHGRAE